MRRIYLMSFIYAVMSAVQIAVFKSLGEVGILSVMLYLFLVGSQAILVERTANEYDLDRKSLHMIFFFVATVVLGLISALVFGKEG